MLAYRNPSNEDSDNIFRYTLKLNAYAMEAKGYSLQSYEEWQDANLSSGGDMNSMEETVIE